MSHKPEKVQLPDTRIDPLRRGIESDSRWTNRELLTGFPQTAHFLATDPDKSTVIFRRFDKASIRNLLNLEGRVAALEAFQEDLDKEDYLHNQDEEDILEVARSWEFFALLGTSFGTRANQLKIPAEAYRKWGVRREKLKRNLEESSEPVEPNLTASSSKHPDTARDFLGLNADTKNLIELRWDVALAIKDAVKEYRK